MTKAFRRNAQPLETSNVPGGIGGCSTNKKNGQSGEASDCPFLHFVYTNALLAKVFTLYFLLARSNINIVLYKYVLYRIVIITVNKVKTLYN